VRSNYLAPGRSVRQGQVSYYYERIREVANRMRKGLRGCRELLALAVAITALLGVQGLSAAPAHAWLTDTEDCPACGDGGAPAGDDGGASANDSGGASDTVPSSGALDLNGAADSESGTPNDAPDPGEVDDPFEYTSPLNDTSTPSYSPPITFPGDGNKLGGDVWSHAIRTPNGETFIWPNPVAMCDGLSMGIVRSSTVIQNNLKPRFFRIHGALKAATADRDRERVDELQDKWNDLSARLDYQYDQRESYRDFYRDKGCTSIYASAAGF
jgi:hypothetical protein